MKKNYSKPGAVVVEMSFNEHIATSGDPTVTCTYTGNFYISDGCTNTSWINNQY